MRINKATTSIVFASSAFLFFLTMLIVSIGAENARTSYLYSIDSQGIYRLDISTRSRKNIFNTAGMYGVSFSVSPSDTVIALVITERGIVPPGAYDYSVVPKNSMIFIDTAGNEITKLDEDVQEFAWSPDGEKIAYITGTFEEDKGFIATGAGIFDLKDKSKRLIKKGRKSGRKIRWARHDNNIYVDRFGYRYNTTTGKIEDVDYRDIDFSPDGKYYKEIEREGTEGTHVYLTATNEDITPQLIERFGPDWSRVSLSWVFDKGHCLHVVRQTAVQKGEFSWEYPVVHNVLYDVENDEVMKEVTLPISRWTASPDKLVFEKDGEFVLWTYEDAYGE